MATESMTEQLQTVVLEEQALARLRELDPQGRHGVLQRVLAAFDASLQRAAEQLAELPAASDEAMLQTLLRTTHTLKSSSASVGAVHLAQACAGAERRLRTLDPLQAQAGGRPGPLRAQLLREAEAVALALGPAQQAVRAMLRP